MMKKLFLILLISTFSASLMAQSPEQKISKSAGIVVSLNAGQMEQKFPLKSFEKLEMWQEVVQQMQKMPGLENAKSLEDLGIDVKGQLFFSFEASDSVNMFSFILPIKDLNKIKELTANLGQVQTDKNGTESIALGNGILTLTSPYAYLVMAEPNYSYISKNEGIYARYGLEDSYSSKKALGSIWADARIGEMTGNMKNNITTLPSYKAANIASNDIGIWVNSSAFANQGLNGMYREFAPILSALSGTMEGNAAWYGINFEKEKIVINSESYLNPKMKKYISSILKGDINPQFAQYVSQKNPIGYYGLAFDMAAAVQNFQDAYGDAINSVPEFGSAANDVWSLLFDVLIDEKALFDVFQGNALFVVTDIKPVEMTYITYEYDDDYNATEVENKKTQTLPIYTFMMGTQKEYMDKVMNILRVSRMLEDKGGYYKIKEGSETMANFILVKNDILFISNDEAEIKSIMGGAKQASLDKRHVAMLKENNHVMYLDMNKLLAKIPKEELGLSSNSQKLYQLGLENSKEIVSTGFDTTANGVKSTTTMSVPNKKINSLEVLFNFINDIYLVEKGKK